MRRIVAVMAVPIAAAASFAALNVTGVASAENRAAVLTGAREVPGPGDPDGLGRSFVTVDGATGTICLTVRTRNVDPLSGGHIHEGSASEAGPVVVDFSAFISADGTSLKGCVVNAEEAAGLIADPSDYYVNVHNEAYPAGAVRGQLGSR
ncbi:MAG: CHRD domain-containing protein [Geodermatophilaceae bacterium]|nr:CHRD domain-containing protein [Geodermatophilaceae bacterium]